MLYDITVTIGGVDVSDWVKAGGTIDYGRATISDGFSSPQAVLDLFTLDEHPAPLDPDDYPAIDVGDTVLIHATWDGLTEYRRFTGVVTALDWSLYNLRVTCAGTSAAWVLKYAGDTTGQYNPYVPATRTAEPDADRAAWFASTAGVTLNIVGTNGRYVTSIPPNTASRPILDLLGELAADCDGLLRETTLGDVDYVLREHTVPDRYTLPSGCVNSDAIDMTREYGALVNAVRVYYGTPNGDGVYPYRYTDDSTGASTIADGERLVELQSQLAFSAGALGRAEQYIADHVLAWTAPDIPLLMNQCTGDDADAILALAEGDPITLDDLPAGCPVASLDATILGWTELLHPSDYRIVLHVHPVDVGQAESDENWAWDGDYTGGDDTGTYTDGDDILWRWHRFTSDGTFAATSGDARPVVGRVLVVAGGGGGGAMAAVWAGAGDGGAGGLADEPVWLTASTSADVVVGAGGAVGTVGPDVHATSGGDSSWDEITVRGGGAGGNGATVLDAISDGWDGGSGGGKGNGSTTYGYALPGVACTSHGTDGDDTADLGSTLGGGATDHDGTGYDSAITGTTVTYAYANAAGASTSGDYGVGGKGQDMTGPYAAEPGTDGVVIVAYPIHQLPV